jgi:hypothetical protein
MRGHAANDQGANKKKPDKGGNRASTLQKRIEGVYMIALVILNKLVSPGKSIMADGFWRLFFRSTCGNDRAVD